MQITLPDSRTLAYAEYGDPGGWPLFFFHGIPGSRLFRPPDEVTAQMGVRLITMDRPGYGLSTFQPGRAFIDWPRDVAALADHLGIDRFAVAGHSGGGPYAAVCAWALPERVRGAALLSSLGPVDAPGIFAGMQPANKMGLQVGRWMPFPLWRLAMQAFYGKAAQHPELLFPDPPLSPISGREDGDGGETADLAVLRQPGVLALCRESVHEAFRQGMLGHAWEGRLHTRPWGFRLEDIRVPVFLWHGLQDVDATPQMGRTIASKIRTCRATLLENEGHLLLFSYWQDILSQLA